MLKPIKLRLNYGSLKGAARSRVSETARPVFSWGGGLRGHDCRQQGYRVRVACGGAVYWDTGWVQSGTQAVRYAGAPLPVAERIVFSVELEDNCGNRSQPAEDYFFIGDISLLKDAPPISWIGADVDEEGRTVYLRKSFRADGALKDAALFACGVGYHDIYLNGEKIDDACLDPAFSDYSKTCYYVVYPELQGYLGEENTIGVMLGEGWRRNNGAYLQRELDAGKPLPLFGTPQLWAALRLTYQDGRVEWITTDASWQWARGMLFKNHLFDGVVYRAADTVSDWNTNAYSGAAFRPVRLMEPPGGTMRPMVIEPVRRQRIYEPISVYQTAPGVYLADFGQNMAGVVRLRLPKLQAGQTVTIRHMELLDEDSRLYLANLRGAKATDTYIAAGDARDLDVWEPQFVYHGFRYAEIEGLELMEPADICAVQLYSDVDSCSYFRSGSALLNAVHTMAVQTERSNIHGILTDCPQRDERMGWMNDATVRFCETPYNFDIGRIFPKILADITDTQDASGAITCTAPFIYGERPADPVCSSFLEAAWQAYLHTGNGDVIQKYYARFCKWQACLAQHAQGYIVQYSHYGDWAAPAYACVGGADSENPCSVVTPGILMSTGYFYYNAVLLARLAEIIGAPAEGHLAQADCIRQAFLEKWYDAESGVVGTGSQACQAFALWLGILPETGRAKAAAVLREDLAANGYQFTTGNLCTRYLLDALAEYGYENDLYTLLTKETYPSFGYMLQNEATTVWERFELKKASGMNSHNHPMYGAVDYIFYRYLAGIRPLQPGFAEFEVKPVYPKELLSVNAGYDSVRGSIHVHWIRRYGELHLYVQVPFNTIAKIYTPKGIETRGSGFWHFRLE